MIAVAVVAVLVWAEVMRQKRAYCLRSAEEYAQSANYFKYFSESGTLVGWPESYR